MEAATGRAVSSQQAGQQPGVKAKAQGSARAGAVRNGPRSLRHDGRTPWAGSEAAAPSPTRACCSSGRCFEGM